jgi:catechol 2,3-dioxygenase-like lactoylglutathione lyase family enzyme
MNSDPTVNSYDVGGVRLARPFRIRRLGHTGFDLVSFDKTVDFYTRVLGFRVSDKLDLRTIASLPKDSTDVWSVFLTYGSDHHALVMVPKSFEEVFGAASPGIRINQITWQVNALSEVVEGAKFVADRGAKIARIGRDLPGSNWAAYFRAPDGHLNEFYYGMEQIGWNRRSKPKSMYGLSFAGQIELPQRPESREIADAQAQGIDIDSGNQNPTPLAPTYPVGGVLLERPFKIVRLGPLRFFVPDIDAATAFYRDMLGLTPTEEVLFEGMRCVFFRAGSEHHSLALYPLALREKLGFSSHSQFMSLGLQVGSYTQLRDAVRFLEEQGCKIVNFPAELHPGIDYTVNVLDPEGHCVQLYYYMEQIGWDGLPRPAHLRRKPSAKWPESIEPYSDTFADSAFQGPLD